MITEGEDTISVYHAATRRCFYNGHVQQRHTVNAVLFDLDDTLFDHEQAARAALASVHRSHSTFTLWPFDAFEQAHARALEELHVDVLTGVPSIDDARENGSGECSRPGASEDVDQCANGGRYREAYLAARRPVEGARQLTALKPRVRIAIVTNNLLDEQQAKITLCGFDWSTRSSRRRSPVSPSLTRTKRSRQWRVRRATR